MNTNIMICVDGTSIALDADDVHALILYHERKAANAAMPARAEHYRVAAELKKCLDDAHNRTEVTG